MQYGMYITQSSLLKAERNLDAGEESVNVAKFVVNHKSEKTHHGGTALVQFDGTLLKLGLFVEAIPSEVNEVVTEVTNELSAGDVLHDGKLQETNKGKNLEGTGNRNGGGSLPAGRNVGELGSGVVNVSRKADSGSGDQVSDNTQHADAAVLDLDVSEAVELLLVTIGNKAKGIEESKRSLGTEFILESLQGSAGGSLLGRGESGGRGDEGGKDGGLHF
jgi:hypothetical protein